MTTRLLKDHRKRLTALAESLITTPNEDAAYEEGRRVALNALRAELDISHTATPAEYATLKKYGCLTEDRCLRLTCTEIAGAYTNFNVLETDTPLQFPRRGYSYGARDVTRATWDLIKTYENLYRARKDAREAKLADYRALIYGARTYEDITSVWPEASRLHDQIVGARFSAPVEVDPAFIDRIKADVASRRAGAEAGVVA
jgi:hypothetical protein